MGKSAAASLLWAACLAAAILSADARIRFNFKAFSTYKDSKVAPAPTKEEEPSTPPATPPAGRYPTGYPGEEHKYDPETGKYVTSSEQPANPSEGRYPKGYYNQADKYADPTPVETVKSSTDRYPPLPNRYEKGYPTSFQQQSKPTTTAAAEPELRYEDGYYGKAHEYAQPNSQSAVMPQSKPTTTTAEPELRYEDGYFGKAHEYAQPNSQSAVMPQSKPTTTTAQPDQRYTDGYFGMAHTYAQQSEQKPVTGQPEERYVRGYYPDSSYAGKANQAGTATKVVSFTSSQGAVHYPENSALSVKFDPNGAGCRTAYWASHPGKWPNFFTSKSTVGDAFGVKASKVYREMTMVQALTKYDGDEFDDLARAGCAALLNSYARGEYKMAHMKVIEQFNVALSSKDAAKAQALAFETANVESISAGHACV